MYFVDSHAHLTDSRFSPDVSDVVARARESSIEWIVTIASDLSDSERTIEAAERFEEVYATVGVHPHEAESVRPETFGRLRKLAGHPRVVAIGETGLDYHYDNSPRAEQCDSFRRHLELAAELGMPVVVHSREADDDLRELIEGVGWERGILHCFSSGPKLLDSALALGWSISFAGMITFPKWDGADLLRSVPADRLLVETDSPYLTPVPHRGRRNEPAFVALVAERAAELRGDDPADLARSTTENARRIYGVAAAR
ncbi:MAG: YchF/TatD family DNA exonuclease [Gemmatimonas sp.]|nr:YchF/TatD family DNA exonuclease [Gemmatimonas sp.]